MGIFPNFSFDWYVKNIASMASATWHFLDYETLLLENILLSQSLDVRLLTPNAD